MPKTGQIGTHLTVLFVGWVGPSLPYGGGVPPRLRYGRHSLFREVEGFAHLREKLCTSWTKINLGVFFWRSVAYHSVADLCRKIGPRRNREVTSTSHPKPLPKGPRKKKPYAILEIDGGRCQGFNSIVTVIPPPLVPVWRNNRK